MEKFPDSAAAVTARGLGQVIDPGIISDIDLLRVHTPGYVQSIRSGEFNAVTRARLGLPWSRRLTDRSHRAVAGTLSAARATMQEGIACNLAGGTHHAFADRGEGFCVFNDVAVAIRALQHDEPYLQAIVIDLDAHQGNGTHAIFSHDPNVFTYSVHVGRNYPSVKVPGTLDVELNRWASADEYFSRLTATLPTAMERFEPDIVFYIGGVDVHADDQFGQMKLSTDDMRQRDRWTIELCRRWTIPTVVLYGGGYNKQRAMTTALHVQTVEMAAAVGGGPHAEIALESVILSTHDASSRRN
jgi:acetoin utilization deacetylase AcuC-like enzyme